MQEWTGILHGLILFIAAIAAIFAAKANGKLKKITLEFNGKENSDDRPGTTSKTQ